ncbi:MAG TPA: alpha/beta fold hydrolase [Mycobacteriales bacterium]|nr:alpha/beta fold hydrolase [Mycobacteriales bacterium]
MTLRELLDVRTCRAYDLTADGQVLVGYDDTGTVQLYEVDPDGRWAQLTDLADGCRGRYLPGERRVVVEHDTAGTERYQLSLLQLDVPGATLEPLAHDERHVHRLVDVRPGKIVYATNRRNGVDFDVVVRDLASGTDRVCYDGGGYVAEVAVSPNERYVVLTRPAAPANSTQLVLVDTGTGLATELTPADEPALYRRPVWAPDSASFTVSTDSGRELAGVARFDLDEVAGTGWSWEYVETDDEWDLAGWPSPDGKRLLVVRNVDGAHELFLDGVAVKLPPGGVLGRLTEPVWSPDGSLLAITYSSPVEPGDVWVVNGGSVVRRTDSAPGLDRTRLVSPTSHRVPAPDGSEIPCFLYRGPDCDGSVVVTVHGGPEAQATRTWSPLIQALVAQGHAVVVPNVRGSTGYGKSWYAADDGRKRLASVADLAAVHAWLPSLGLEPGRAALHGGSYGGYLVLAGLTMQPELWAAGVDIVGISSLVTFLENTSAYRRAHREREYGSLAADRDFLVAASPITHIDAIRAPLLILHGANDPRVPLGEAEQIAAAVRARRLECELVVYPDEGHAFGKRATLYDSQPRIAAFLARQLRGG